MMSEMVLDRTSNLVMPVHYVELDREEVSYVDGGGFWANLFGGMGLVLNLGSLIAAVVPGCQPIAIVAGIAGCVFDIDSFICGICGV